MEAVLLFSLLLVFIALSIPIGITLGLATGICLALTTDIPLTLIAQKSFTGLDSFPLLAIPFFILAGALMCNGGISKRLVNLAESLVGFIVGGLAMVTVLACMFFAAISGSGPATVSATPYWAYHCGSREISTTRCHSGRSASRGSRRRSGTRPGRPAGAASASPARGARAQSRTRSRR